MKKRQLKVGKSIDISVEKALDEYNKSIELQMPLEEE
jgi:hypothetical protein